MSETGDLDRGEQDLDRVGLFVTCVADVVTPGAAVASVRLLRAAGCEVSVPEGQTCCGQPAWNAGFTDEAAAVARASLDALAATDDDVTVVVPAGSCATMIRRYWPQLFTLAEDPDAAQRAEAIGARTRELTEALSEREIPPPRAGADRTVAYHKSCHMLRELGLDTEPTDLLASVGCEVAEWPGDDRCCGFGGTFSVKLPEASAAMADDKLDSLPDGVTEIVGADSSCLVHLRGRAEQRGMDVTTRHVAEVVADARPDDVARPGRA